MDRIVFSGNRTAVAETACFLDPAAMASLDVLQRASPAVCLEMEVEVGVVVDVEEALFLRPLPDSDKLLAAAVVEIEVTSTLPVAWVWVPAVENVMF